jgi:hypothetical protein
MDLLCDVLPIINRTSTAQPDLSSCVLLATLLSNHDAKLWKPGTLQSPSRPVDQTVSFGALNALPSAAHVFPEARKPLYDKPVGTVKPANNRFKRMTPMTREHRTFHPQAW